MSEFNIIVTTQRGNERGCIRELLTLVDELEGPKTVLARTRFPGLLKGMVEGDPLELTRKIRARADEDPWSFRFVQRLIPIQQNVPADPKKIGEAISAISQFIPTDASFRIVLDKRGSDLRTSDLIHEAATGVKRKVDLENPDWIIQIEIIDEIAGISILRPDDVLSIAKLQEEAIGN